jgi:UDP:flavonoid glycosyltransferase YjiC (YdhE family)
MSANPLAHDYRADALTVQRSQPCVLFTWEIGNGLGHVLPMLTIARHLKTAGYRVVFALRDVRHAASLLEAAGMEVMQAPYHPDRQIGRHETQPDSMADVLALFGFTNAVVLRNMAATWRRLLQHLKPSVVIASYAPLSLLCAREQGIPTAVVAMPFELPPSVHPLPSTRTGAARSQAGQDEAVLDTVRSVFSAQRFGSVASLFAADRRWIMSFPELDFLFPRKDAQYCGSLSPMDQGVPITIDKPVGQKLILAYLKTELPGLQEIQRAALISPHRWIIYLRGADEVMRASWCVPHIEIHTQPLKLKDVLPPVDVVLSHAGQGMTSASLLAGKPLVMTTDHLESTLNARCVQRMGAGVASTVKTVSAALDRVLGDDRFTQQAQRFAHKYRNYSVEKVSETLARDIQALSSQSKTPSEKPLAA